MFFCLGVSRLPGRCELVVSRRIYFWGLVKKEVCSWNRNDGFCCHDDDDDDDDDDDAGGGGGGPMMMMMMMLMMLMMMMMMMMITMTMMNRKIPYKIWEDVTRSRHHTQHADEGKGVCIFVFHPDEAKWFLKGIQIHQIVSCVSLHLIEHSSG